MAVWSTVEMGCVSAIMAVPLQKVYQKQVGAAGVVVATLHHTLHSSISVK
jgi:hypothetical protein